VTAEGVAPTIAAVYNQRFPYSSGFDRWEQVLQAGGVIHGATRTFPTTSAATCSACRGSCRWS